MFEQKQNLIQKECIYYIILTILIKMEEDFCFYNVHTQPFSNFFPSPFTVDEKQYPTAEHYYQSKKFAGTDQEDNIRKASSIEQCHYLGQQLSTLFDSKKWDQIREKVYEGAVYNKFLQNKGLNQKLLETGLRKIINIDQDEFWGMKYNEQLDRLVGENKTGEILMKVRAILKDKVLNELK